MLQIAESARLNCHVGFLGSGIQIVFSGRRRISFGATGCGGAKPSGVLLARSSGGQIL